jgi:gluconokinase
MIVILMGASGAGKTTVGRALAAATGWPFYDADDLHPADNVDKMRQGTPLTDTDRTPWLARVRGLIAELAGQGASAVIGCSALRESYRRVLAEHVPDVRWVFLRADPDLLRQRLIERSGHYAGPAILPDQLATLEEPSNALVLAAARPVHALVLDICKTLALRCGGV